MSVFNSVEAYGSGVEAVLQYAGIILNNMNFMCAFLFLFAS